jgi:type IV pilus assembly protein PilA
VVLAASQCRTSVSEVYQTAPAGTTPGAGGWGCETATGTKYVSSVATDGNGVITVTSSADAGLGAAASKTITLTPIKTGTTAAVVGDIPLQIASFTCKAGSMDPKFLPGSCK